MKKLFVIGALFLFLTACGNSVQPTTSNEAEESQAFVFDWKTDIFQRADEVSQGKQYQMKTYHEWEHGVRQEGNTYFFYYYSCDTTSFLTGIKKCEYTEDLSKMLSAEYELERMNPETGEITTTSITEEEFHRYFDDPKEAGLLPPLELYTKQDSQALVSGIAYSDDGELVYAVYNEEKNVQEIKWYNNEIGMERVLGEVPYSQFEELLGMKGQKLFYSVMNELVCWNVETGEREMFFSATDNGFKKGSTMQLLIGGDVIYLRCIDTEEDSVMELTPEEIDNGETVMIVDISGDNSQRNIVGESAAVFSRKNPGSFVELAENETDEESYRTRIMAEVTTGQGPDILLVNREDMKLLYEKGWAADLREYLSDDTLKELLPGVIDMGTVEETLVGLAPEVSVRALFTKRNIWDKESWTVADVIGLLQENCNQKQYMVDYIDDELSAGVMLYNFALWDLENSLFIDWEEGESNFDGEAFASLLEMIEGYEGIEYTQDEKTKLLQSGESLAISTPLMWRFDDFVVLADMLGDDFYPIGFPSEAGSANYLQEGKLVVVNKRTESPEKVSAFLEYLVSEKAQVNTLYYSVRRNSVTEDMLRRDTDRENEWVFSDGKNEGVRIIRSKSDVMAYVKQYNEFLENCKPLPKNPEVLENIIWDGLDAFLDGVKSAEETAETIDNRVQLYLDERG